MCLSDRRLALTLRLSSGRMLFIALPPFETHILKANISLSLFMLTIRVPGLLHTLALLQHQHLLSASRAPSSTRNPSSGWNVSVHRKIDPCKLCTGIQTVYSPRRCKLFIMIRPFTTRRAFAHSAACELAGSIGH